jgi:hypothetical protein
MPDLNFRKKIIDVSKILKSWQHKKLTLLGKVTVIKTLALPKPREKSIPSSLKLDTDQFNLKSGQRI